MHQERSFPITFPGVGLLKRLEQRKRGEKLLEGIPIKGESLAHVDRPENSYWRNPALVQPDGEGLAIVKG
ncbi:MAG: hypothetical protein DMG80_19685 [Acidobacteria bacterium]|nr:MAG: hypothetical protein DMG80_19685 [Acidobacteriota bacterium]